MYASLRDKSSAMITFDALSNLNNTFTQRYSYSVTLLLSVST
ncbi:hypothetical protein HMPREF3214_00977 [Alloscardovia omnicolens]|nr:hypothetical protein HMPREF3214_00977 [Alloscardovia omnicolens]